MKLCCMRPEVYNTREGGGFVSRPFLQIKGRKNMIEYTNEQIVELIQQGHDELYLDLWNRVKRFVRKMAWFRVSNTIGFDASTGFGSVEINDLMQAGYIAMMEAVKSYENKGASFLTWLSFHLKKEFNEAQGFRTTRQARDPLNRAKSLDRPLKNASGEDDETTLADIIKDDSDPFSPVIEKIYQAELRKALDGELNTIQEKSAEVIRMQYWDGKTQVEIGKEIGCSSEVVRRRKESGFKSLRLPQHRRQLEQFLDNNTSFYIQVGPNAFTRTHTSAVERIVFQREHLAKKYKEMLELENRIM